MKKRNKMISKAGFYYYYLLAFITNGNKRFVDKKLLFGAILIGLNSQYGCKSTNSEKDEVLNIKNKNADDKVTNEKDTFNHLYTNGTFDTVLHKDLNGINVIDNVSCYLIKHSTENKPVFQLKTTKSTDTVGESDSSLICYMVVELLPEFPGGEEKLFQFLQENLKYPQKAIDSNIQGRVYTTFTVGIDGKIRNVRILRGLSKECDAEAIRLIKLMPDWKPGNQNGKPVPSQMNLPVIFKLN